MARKYKIIILIAAVTAALAAYFLFYYGAREKREEFRTTGTVEAVETSIASKIPGRLIAVGFREGDKVKAGDVIARIDPAEYEDALGQAEASLAASRAALKNGYASAGNARAQSKAARADIERSRAEVAKAEAALTQSGKDLARASELFSRGVIPRAELDTAVTAMETAKAGLSASRAAQAASESLAVAADARVAEAVSQVETLKAGVSVAESGVELARTRLADTVITSPVDATVEYRTLEPGEVVAPGTSILTLATLDDIRVRFDMDERLVNTIKAGDNATVSLEYMPGKTFSATIFDIGREAQFAVERDVTRGRQDIRAFRTRARVADPAGILKPGMTVIVTIPLG